MPWGAVASVAGSVVSGAMGSNAADDAAKASAKATAASNKMLKEQQDTNITNYSPYTNLGASAANRLSYYMGLTPSSSIPGLTDQYLAKMAGEAYDKGYRLGNNSRQDIINGQLANYHNGVYGSNDTEVRKYLGIAEPEAVTLDTSDGNYGSLLNNFSQNDLNKDVVYNNGLQFGLDQGTSALNRLASANGGIDSGATLKALTRYANDYGTTKASGAYDRFNTNKLNTYNMLSGQAGQGLNATSSLAGINSNLLTGQSNNTMNNGANQGQYGIMGAQSINNAVQGGIGNYLYNQRTNTPINQPIVGSSGGGSGGINLSGYTNSIPWYA